jgi:hypothetical protein
MKFYSGLVKGKPRFTFVVVSNKPLDQYDAICKAVADGDTENSLPSGVIVICHDVFQGYAACFAHRGLFIPLSSKRNQDIPEESQTILEGCTKKQKMECDDDEQNSKDAKEEYEDEQKEEEEKEYCEE